MLKLALYQKILLLVALIGFSNHTFARDIGVIGKTYEIQEQDLVELIKERLLKKQQAGEIDKLNQQMLKKGKQYATTPPGVRLPVATRHTARTLDPLYTLDRDIKDDKGKILFFKGTQVNPLKLKPLTKTLCFIDGADERQVAWMIRYCAGNKLNKLILVNGNHSELTQKIKKRLYFDQHAFLVKRFGITELPTVIRQGGELLYVETFPVD